MSQAKWWVDDGGRRYGPVTGGTLVDLWQRGRLGPQALVASDGGDAWIPADRAPPVAEAIATVRRATQPTAHRERLRRERWMIAAAVVAFLLFAGWVAVR